MKLPSDAMNKGKQLCCPRDTQWSIANGT